MDQSQKKKKLSPARNGAAYPTLNEAGLDRKLLVAGAAALALGLSCSTQGEPPIQPQDAEDAEVAFGPDSSGGIFAPDGGYPSEDGGGNDPDGGQGGLP